MKLGMLEAREGCYDYKLQNSIPKAHTHFNGDENSTISEGKRCGFSD